MVSTKTTTRRRAIGKRVRRTTTRRRAIGKRLVVGKKKGSCRRYNRQQSLRQSGRYRQVVKKTIGGTNITIDKIDIINGQIFVDPVDMDGGVNDGNRTRKKKRSKWRRGK